MLDILPISKSLWRNKISMFLIITQLALTIAIVSNALFFISQRQTKIDRPTGIAINELLTVSAQKLFPDTDLIGLVKADIEFVRNIPGVIDAALFNGRPLSGSGSTTTLTSEPSGEGINVSGNIFSMTEHGLNTLGLNLIAGRNFTAEEIVFHDDPNFVPTGEILVIVSKKFADQILPEGNAVGTTIYTGGDIAVRIIGVVERMMGSYPNSESVGSVVFVPLLNLTNAVNYQVRTEESERGELLLSIVEGLRADDSQRIISNEGTMAEVLKLSYTRDYAMIKILYVVVFMLVLVNSLGIVGLTTFWVNQRRKQIGIRRALGASKAATIRYFLVENAILCCCGAVLGGALALLASDYMVREYAMDLLPWQYVPLTGFVVLLMTMLAAATPAWRAAKVSPAEATA